MNPLVSFVVPCYKLAHLLPQCVNSILEQTYENYEILIMDNACETIRRRLPSHLTILE